ncbi:hypothetical protein FHW00_003933 [Ochrobactrum sp. P6BSIII]|nr:hypothetical protein [Ochrobactrum sp. P6BSIII]
MKDVSVLIDGLPKPIFLTSDADDDFIQMPDMVWAGTLPLEPTGIVRAEFQSSSTDGLIRNDNTTLQQHFLDHAQAQRTAKVEPHRLGDDLGGKR